MLASYLARMGFTFGAAPLRGRLSPLDEARIRMRVWPSDIDTYLHVNNGRYLTLMDFGRLDHWVRSGLAWEVLRHGWAPVAGAATVSFRRELRMFERFDLTTRLAHWDDKWFYFEHRMVRGADVHAWAAVKAVVKRRRETIRPADVLALLGVTAPAPAPGDELAGWIRIQRR